MIASCPAAESKSNLLEVPPVKKSLGLTTSEGLPTNKESMPPIHLILTDPVPKLTVMISYS
jgi:hypothetical protein